MPKLPSKELTKVEEGKLVEVAGPLFDYFVITSKQIKQFNEAVLEAANVYKKVGENLTGIAKTFVQAQENLANQLYGISSLLENIGKISFVIPVPKLYSQQNEPIPIYIQPDKPYVPKLLPTPKRKQTFPLERVMIKEKGFVLNGEYISGMTINSQPGRLFELMIRSDLGGIIPDDLLGSVLRTKKGDYFAFSTVINDLKNILRKNHLKLDMVRNRAIKEYRVKAITKRIRNPKKKKKVKNMDRIN